MRELMVTILLTLATVCQFCAVTGVSLWIYNKSSKDLGYNFPTYMSRIVCLGGAVCGFMACYTAWPEEIAGIVATGMGAIAMLFIGMGYAGLIGLGGYVIKPAYLLTRIIRGATEPRLKYEEHISSFLFGWVPFFAFGSWLVAALIA